MILTSSNTKLFVKGHKYRLNISFFAFVNLPRFFPGGNTTEPWFEEAVAEQREQRVHYPAGPQPLKRVNMTLNNPGAYIVSFLAVQSDLFLRQHTRTQHGFQGVWNYGTVSLEWGSKHTVVQHKGCACTCVQVRVDKPTTEHELNDPVSHLGGQHNSCQKLLSPWNGMWHTENLYALPQAGSAYLTVTTTVTLVYTIQARITSQDMPGHGRKLHHSAGQTVCGL